MFRLLVSYMNAKNLSYLQRYRREFIVFYPSRSTRSTRGQTLKTQLPASINSKLIVSSCGMFYLETAMTSEERERKTSLPGAAVIAKQYKGGKSASILGHHSLQTRTNIRFYRTQLYSYKVFFFVCVVFFWGEGG